MDGMADFMGDGEAQAIFETRTHEGAFVHGDGFQIAHGQGVNVQLFVKAKDSGPLHLRSGEV
jgi:hypothetical protein